MFGGGGTYVLRSGGKLRERDMERMETQTNIHYSISTKYGIESRGLDERCKGYVTLLFAWRPLAQSPSRSGLQHDS